MHKGLFFLACLFFSLSAQAAASKDWTMLVFLNGHNNLDGFGALNINQMETVGSTSKINVVVQWASTANGDTKRMLIKKDKDPNAVTSPVVEQLPAVNMGDWKNLVEFIRWGVEKYPAKRYMVVVWNHGSGWNLMNTGQFRPTDISYDDIFGYAITTPELGLAMDEAAKIMGHKVDIYASDACLMGMVEVAAEMQNSVSYFAGSEETEPGDGWPYDTFLKKWNQLPDATPEQVIKLLSMEYVNYYTTDGMNENVTFSGFDLSKLPSLVEAVRGLGQEIRGMDPGTRKSILDSMFSATSFSIEEYVDLLSFIENLELDYGLLSLRPSLDRVKQGIGDTVFVNEVSPRFMGVGGISMWLPASRGAFEIAAPKYDLLKFAPSSEWLQTLKYLHKK